MQLFYMTFNYLACDSWLLVMICVFVQIVDKRLMDGADEYLQLMDLSSVIMEQLCHACS